MEQGQFITNCWGQSFTITPAAAFLSNTGEAARLPSHFYSLLHAASFVSTLSDYDIKSLCHRFCARGFGNAHDIQKALFNGQLKAFPTASLPASLSALSSTHLTGDTHTANTVKQSESRSLLVIRSDIKLTLRLIVEQEQQETKQLEASYQKRSDLSKTGAHISHFASGVYNSVESLLIWANDIHDVVSLNQRLLRIMKAASMAQQTDEDDRYQVFKNTLAASEKKEIIEALGFDPSLITDEKVTQAYELANLIYEDQLTQLIISQFIKDYINAQHSLEWSEFAGGAAFEVILTAILMIFTGGAGLVASVGAKARQVIHLKKLGTLFLELAEGLKKIPKQHSFSLRKIKEKEDRAESKKAASKQKTDKKPVDKPSSKPITSFDEAESRLSDARKNIEQRKAAGKPLYKPKYTDAQLLSMAKNGSTANDRFLVSVQTKNTSPDATLAYQRESGLVPAWTTSFNQLEAADSDPKLIHQVLGIESNFDPNKDYVMHIIDRGESFDQFGNNTIVPTWDKLSDASVNALPKYDESTIRSTMNSDYQAKYADNMQTIRDAGGSDFNKRSIERYTTSLKTPDKELFSTRHAVRTELGANSEFTGNGLTANTALGGGQSGVVETLSLERDLPNLLTLQANGVVKTINLTPI